MATLTITSSNWDVGQIRITYTALNGTLTITEIEAKRKYARSWDEGDKSISVSVGGVSKNISLSHYVDFNTSWTSWGAADTSWSGITETAVSISTTMPSSTTKYSKAKFTGTAEMIWDTPRLDLNIEVDDELKYSGDSSVALFDLYINGAISKQGIKDFCQDLAYGTTYEFKLVQIGSGYENIEATNAKGTITNQSISVLFKFKELGLCKISDGTSYADHKLYLHDEDGYSPYIPYVHDGTEWKRTY